MSFTAPASPDEPHGGTAASTSASASASASASRPASPVLPANMFDPTSAPVSVSQLAKAPLAASAASAPSAPVGSTAHTAAQAAAAADAVRAAADAAHCLGTESSLSLPGVPPAPPPPGSAADAFPDSFLGTPIKMGFVSGSSSLQLDWPIAAAPPDPPEMGSEMDQIEPMSCPVASCSATLTSYTQAGEHFRLHTAFDLAQTSMLGLLAVSDASPAHEPAGEIAQSANASTGGDEEAHQSLRAEDVWSQPGTAEDPDRAPQPGRADDADRHPQEGSCISDQALAQVQEQAARAAREEQEALAAAAAAPPPGRTQTHSQSRSQCQSHVPSQSSPSGGASGYMCAPMWPQTSYFGDAQAYLAAVAYSTGMVGPSGSPDPMALLSTAPSSAGSPGGHLALGAGTSAGALTIAGSHRKLETVGRRARRSAGGTIDAAGGGARTRARGTFLCQFCGISVSRMDSLTRHVKRKHPSEVQAAGGNIGAGPLGIPSLLAPRTSPTSTMTTASTADSSSVSSPLADGGSGRKAVACSLCGLALSRADSLSRHLKKQHSQDIE